MRGFLEVHIRTAIPKARIKIDGVLASRQESQPDLCWHATIADPQGMEPTT